MLKTFPKGGVHPAENKLSASRPIEVLPLPEQVSIPIAQLPLKVEAIIREQFQFEAGTDQESIAPLLTYQENDPGDFIK